MSSIGIIFISLIISLFKYINKAETAIAARKARKAEDKNISVLEKMRLHGKRYVEMLDGGSALHANLKEHLSKEQYKQLLKVACENGTNYFTFNVKNTRCKDCGHISKHTLDACPRCGGKNLSYLTRIIGYLKEVNSFSEPRQEEEGNRYYE